MSYFIFFFFGHGLFLDQLFFGPNLFFTKTTTTKTTTTTLMGFDTIEINLVVQSVDLHFFSTIVCSSIDLAAYQDLYEKHDGGYDQPK